MGMSCTHENSHVNGSKMVKPALKEKGMDSRAHKAGRAQSRCRMPNVDYAHCKGCVLQAGYTER